MVDEACACAKASGDPRYVDFVSVEREEGHEGWGETWCVCKHCHTKWKVTIDIGYWKPLYVWQRL